MNGLALCAGAGGLELAMRLVLPGYHCVAHVERDAYAAATLMARMADTSLDLAPVWDDLSTFDPDPWRGVVDLVTAGFPCQPWSAAGQGAGTDDERWIWPLIADCVRRVAPRLAFLENVPPLAARGGLGLVLGDLADLGLDAEWMVLRASDVGASHQRARLFILAYRHGDRLQGVGWEPSDDRDAWHDADGSCGAAMADAISGGRRGRASEQEREPVGRAVARSGCHLPLFPPGPDDLDEWSGVLAVRPDVEPSLHGMADGMAHRVDRHHTIGNGVVPLVAATAFGHLARRAGLVGRSRSMKITGGSTGHD